MKAFFKQVLAVVVGLIIVGCFAGVMSLILFFSMLAMDSGKPSIPRDGVLQLKLSGTITERYTESPIDRFLGNSPAGTQGLDNILAAIREAATNDRIRGIYIESDLFSADVATLQEVRHALQDFKKSGKFILAYADSYTQAGYYVASVADSVLINPSGMLDWHGLAGTVLFYKDLLDKVGVKMQIFRVGKYKSFVEPYTRTDMSAPNRRQAQAYIGDIWHTMLTDVSAARQVPVDTLNAYADRYVTFADATDYVKLHLADGTAYADGVRDALRRLSGTKKVHLVSVNDLAANAYPGSGSDGEIAVYYAEGDIVGAETGGLPGTPAQIVGPKVVEDLDRLADDDNIKAVVLRINSPGGSAYASEQMWRAVSLLRKKKPVVVSMGGVAASGGYYLACGADYIFAEPTTVTGSIGIFGMIPDISGLATERLGLHFDVVKTNEASDFGNILRPMSAGEGAALQASVDRGYALFLKRVAQGRRMSVAAVDSVAQGRVWTGRQALKVGLVDRLGRLDEAVAEAARRAKVRDYAVAAFPSLPGWMDQLLGGFKSNYMEGRVARLLGQYYEPLRFVGTLQGRDCLQARMPFAVTIR